LKDDKPGTPTKNEIVARTLPWAVAGGALLFYLLTISPGLSLINLRAVARVADWVWHPDPGRPLAWLVFMPFRVLPETWQPLGLNLVTTVVAVLVLAQLARSVAILRLDMVATDPMRQKVSETAVFAGPNGWLPPVLAVLALGLQTEFWKHATSASGEMLSVLCFAFAFRGILEYRRAREEKWLYRAALVFAAGMTDNWWLLGYLPVFVAGVIWTKGFSPFLEGRFLVRMLAWAVAGLSLYLIVPTVLVLTGPEQWDFWGALKSYLGVQKSGLTMLRTHVFRLLALVGLLPFLLLAVRWRSHSVQLADDTRHGVFVTKLSGHFIHLSFLITALWLALSPVLTPYQLELSPPLLVYSYPWALVAGYGVAYLLVFGLARGNRSPVRWPAVTAKVLLGVVPALLLWQNWSDLRLTNGGALRELARQLYADLPTEPTTVLSDDPRLLLLVRSELARHDGAKKPLLVDTRFLPLPDYHRRLSRDHVGRWPELPPPGTNLLSAAGMSHIIRQMATQERLVYLHPSSGLFFEPYEVVPHGWAQTLRARGSESAGASEAAAPATALWEERWQDSLGRLADQITAARQRQTRLGRPPFKSLKLTGRSQETAVYLGRSYTKALNHWGVQLARAGDRTMAATWYERALAFDADNLAARINSEYVAQWHRGETNRLSLTSIQEDFPGLQTQFNTWAEVVSRNGPVDEPTTLLHVGLMYLKTGYPQQARQQFARSVELEPNWISSRLGLAKCLNLTGDYAQAEALTAGLSQAPELQELRGPALAQFLQVRTTALWRLGQTNAANRFIAEFAGAQQQSDEVVLMAAELCLSAGAPNAELKWRELLVQRDPKRPEWLVKKGQAELRNKQPEAAIKTLTAALTLAADQSDAQLFRGIAALQTGQLEQARRDFQELVHHPEHASDALFGLGSVAWHQADTNGVMHYYQTFLSNSPAANPQTILATQRLKAWQNE
jgi:tetratricopeptide (TPR) repeat protein